MNKFKDGMIGPTVILGVICLVITLALAFTYQLTEQKIKDMNAQVADEARSIVLASAGSEGFTPVEGEMPEGVTEYYVANNGSGVVVTSQSKSFGGNITVMTGFDAQGAITGVTVTAHGDTPGLGTKAMTVDYLSQYIGVNELDNVENIKKDSKVSAVSGATVSSNGIYSSVKYAIIAFQEMGGVNA